MSEVPVGYCQCGCGQKTTIAKHTNAERGITKGQPNHYLRGHRAEMRRSFIERFWSNVNVAGPDECWEWKAAKNSNGYGEFYDGIGQVLAHRYAYEITNMSILKGLACCHTCDNPSCVNPAHLWVGTQHDNMTDKVQKNRQQRGERVPGAKLTTDDVREIRRLCADGTQQKAVAHMYGIGTGAVCRIVKRQRWAHVE